MGEGAGGIADGTVRRLRDAIVVLRSLSLVREMGSDGSEDLVLGVLLAETPLEGASLLSLPTLSAASISAMRSFLLLVEGRLMPNDKARTLRALMLFACNSVFFTMTKTIQPSREESKHNIENKSRYM